MNGRRRVLSVGRFSFWFICRVQGEEDPFESWLLRRIACVVSYRQILAKLVGTPAIYTGTSPFTEYYGLMFVLPLYVHFFVLVKNNGKSESLKYQYDEKLRNCKTKHGNHVHQYNLEVTRYAHFLRSCLYIIKTQLTSRYFSLPVSLWHDGCMYPLKS